MNKRKPKYLCWIVWGETRYSYISGYLGLRIIEYKTGRFCNKTISGINFKYRTLIRWFEKKRLSPKMLNEICSKYAKFQNTFKDGIPQALMPDNLLKSDPLPVLNHIENSFSVMVDSKIKNIYYYAVYN